MMLTGQDRPLILVTGGAGYIGSHCSVELLQSGYDVAIVDNLCNSFRAAITRIEELAGRKVDFHQVDLLDELALEAVFAQYDEDGKSKIHAVIHFAGLKAVGESSQEPLKYYQNNITGSLILFQCMERHSVRRLVYSSSATVYGEPPTYPIHEECPTSPNSPYGRTKLFIERIIEDTSRTHSWQSVILRYFNPVGAHPSGELGEHPQGIPNNLMPYLAQVAIGKLSSITVFGTDYFTRDGTGLRDYIHVMDLCRGHLAALLELGTVVTPGCAEIFNLGTGTGYTVLEMIDAFSEATKTDIPFQLGPRRPGDVATLLADPIKANEQLKWRAEYNLNRMCVDLWRWQSTHPNGFSKSS
ncbi:UDP-galactose-4-epimerase [Paramicrosporidium saccamoebae]|uniref:UDP-glucose 4-epimerase n=1 Tax=Paramicrosporidium saccamoebae TaxID=1246581 RepID=A0A2H9TG47_9FUNG|nr:UDP-galactose-4-epimerase [Paramicrosporidium saccamoebae]